MSVQMIICMQCGGQVVPNLNVQHIRSDGVVLTATISTTSSSMKICTCTIAVVDKSKESHPNEKWHIVPKDTHTGAVTFALNSLGLDIEATTKWGGCTDLWLTEKDYNGEEKCYHHICDLDEFIAQLQAVRAKGRAYFYGDFGVAPLTDEQRQQKIVDIQQEDQ